MHCRSSIYAARQSPIRAMLVILSLVINVLVSGPMVYPVLAATPSIYRTINFGGDSINIDGQQWEGNSAANVQSNGGSFCNQGIALTPETSRERATMLRCSIWSRDLQVQVSAVPLGWYDVYAYVWEDKTAQTYDIRLNGVYAVRVTSGSAGRWERLGPYRVATKQGMITLTTRGGDAKLSGLELWQVGSSTEGDAPQDNRPSVSTTLNRSVFISSERVTYIRSAIQQQRSPNYDAYRDLLGECRDAISADEHAPSTIYVPGYYVDPVGHGKAKEPIKTDANNVYALGLCYRISDDERYAHAAAKIIEAWATKVQEIKTDDDTTLVLSYHFPAMIFGADLIRPSRAYKAVDREFTDFLQRKMVAGSSIDRISHAGCGYTTGDQVTNNWSDWGTVLTISIGAFTQDDALFNKAVGKWKSNIAFQVDEEGTLPIEGRRNNCTGDAGLGYTNFALQALSITAEIAANNGVDLFHYMVNGDLPYLRAWKRTAHDVRYPSTFPFADWDNADYATSRYDVAWFEIANNYFPNGDAEWVLGQFRPVVSREAFRYGTLTHGDLKIDPPRTESAYLTGEWSFENVSASSDDGNKPSNVLDNNLATRWSANEDGQWIAFDAGIKRYVETCEIAFYLGDKRKADFTIEVSDDGTTWKQVYNGSSDGMANGMQAFSFGRQVARFLRIKGYGNTKNDWNSLTEVRVR